MAAASLPNSPSLFREPRPSAWSTQAKEDPIRVILEKYRTLTVVGLSSKVSRPSFGVTTYMRAHGYRIIPVNPNETSVLGEKAYRSLEDVPEALEVVVVFRRSDSVPGVVEGAIRKGAKVLWMQEGVIHEEAAQRARDAGMVVIQDRCILKEHARRFVSDGI
jgi:uncharacterized protein